MRLGTAIERLVEAYNYASDKEWINDKVAWALYHTWKEADRKTEPTISKMEQAEEPQTEDEILREQCRAFMGIVEQTERSE